MSLARENGKNVWRVLVDRDGYADLYRTIVAGPSGQRSDLLVGRVYYTWQGPWEMEIIRTDGPFQGSRSGYASRTHDGRWAITEDMENDGFRFIGYASTLSLGVDVLTYGEHAATRNHDHRRISPGKWEPYVRPTLDELCASL